MKITIKNALIACGIILLLVIAGESSGGRLIKIYTIFSDKGTAIVKYSYCRFIKGEGRNARPGSFELSFSFTANDSDYYITNNRFEQGYHYTRLWNEKVGFAPHEKFEVTYYKKNPYLCIPTKCIKKTLLDQLWGALSVVFLIILFSVTLIRRFQKIKKLPTATPEAVDGNLNKNH